MKKLELLSPAGSATALDAAIFGGADAVYLGLTNFSARANASNFTPDALREAVKKAHNAGVRVCVALNTAVFDREMRDALTLAESAYLAGVDAFIVSDLGLAKQIRERMPDIHLHASTQASGHNADAAVEFAKLGFSRMVAARELDKNDLAELCKNSPIEIEAFVHGALCASVSGQCLMSAMIGGRSGNRGECAQPCRMSYNGADNFPLSLRDNCLAAHLNELREIGVASLKIEGRMKGADYVFAVTRAYRRLLDEGKNATERDIAALAAVFSRGGFTDGYFTGKIGKSMLGVRSAADKTASDLANVKIIPTIRDLPKIEIGERVLAAPPFASVDKTERALSAKPARSARFTSAVQIPSGAVDYFSAIYLPLDAWSDGKSCSDANGVALPVVITENERYIAQKALFQAVLSGAKNVLVTNLGHVALVKEVLAEAKKTAEFRHSGDIRLIGDFRLNITNRYAAEFYGGIFDEIILSPELCLRQIQDFRGAVSAIAYGRLPLMTLECPPSASSLRDRTGAVFPLILEGRRKILLNSVPTYTADKPIPQGCGEHFLFTTESSAEVERIIAAYKKHTPPVVHVRRIPETPQTKPHKKEAKK